MKKQIENKKMNKKVYISIKLYKKSCSIKKIKFTFTPNVLHNSTLGVNIVFYMAFLQTFSDLFSMCDGCRRYLRRLSQIFSTAVES